jgi:hypothetical protein
MSLCDRTEAVDAPTRLLKGSPLIGVAAVVLFLAADVALVICALLWLSERRADADITDFRKRDRERRRV